MSEAEIRDGTAAVDALLKRGDLVSRWDAGDEIARILHQRETSFPRAVAAGHMNQAEADFRNARLACAWAYVVWPGITLAGPHSYRTELEIALSIADARGLNVHGLTGERRRRSP